MSTSQPQPPVAPDPHAEGAHQRRNPWMWISALLAVIAIGLGVWAYSAQSDLDSTQQDVEELQAQVDQSKETGGTVLATVKAAFQDLAAQLGATNEDLANTKQQLQDAQASAQKAAQDAAAAVEGSTEQAQAKAQEAQSKATVAADCAKAYAGAIGALFEGDSVREQASAVKGQLQDISATCKTALQGA